VKITAINVYERILSMTSAYNMSSSAVGDASSTIVELLTDSEHIGYGEICPTGPLPQPEHAGSIRADLELLAPVLVGLNPVLIGHVLAAMNSAMDGGVGAKSAIDIACWDLLGKATGHRVCDLLGGPLMDPVSTYHVIAIGTPDESASSANHLQNDGHTKLQLKAGGRRIEDDIRAAHAVASVIRPGVDLFVDANRGFSVEQAIQFSHACAGLRLNMEQPCHTYEACAAAKPSLVHPLLLDESAKDLATVAKAISSGVANGFGMKLTRVGGLSGMRAIRDLCLATNTPTSFDDSWGGDIIASACVHIGSTMPPALSRGAWISHPYHQCHYDEINGPRIEGGRVAIPSGGPGLGLVIPTGYFGTPLASHN